ncbi:DUF3710 domain-containing protein [Nesterenkonia sp. PF2B19]|uniref:DUF3710 domain-containing protein n=1 Tax=Nesterenkonia sp. PF2B19 TaxID=1881858 RepID=UPI000A19DA98|nr:DUF3710 domain-containing protein [Nesterenkonia sp. PF2B19]OSM43874.1 hypothetical protein BCY76_005470 [Nesterenkonia sp. PF2B19]
MIFGRRKKSQGAEKAKPATIRAALREEETSPTSPAQEETTESSAAPEQQSATAPAPQESVPQDSAAAGSETGGASDSASDGATEDNSEDASERIEGGGPYDVTEVETTKGYIDFGAVLVPAGKEQKVRLDIDQKTKRVVALTISVGQASIQIQPFSAPKSGGTWDEVREQIQDSVVRQKGRIKQLDGRFGKELAARVPTTLKDGRAGWRVARFIGFEGNRWFLRGVVGGRGAIDPQAARDVEDLFSRLVVVRGDDPLPPRELLAAAAARRRTPGGAAAEPGAASGRRTRAESRRCRGRQWRRGPERRPCQRCPTAAAEVGRRRSGRLRGAAAGLISLADEAATGGRGTADEDQGTTHRGGAGGCDD